MHAAHQPPQHLLFPVSYTHLQIIRTKKKPLGLVGLIILLAFLFIAIFADLIAPYPMTDGVMQTSILSKLQGPSPAHLLGTDNLGRDVLSYLIYGARTSAILGICCTLLSVAISVIIGTLSAVIGGWFDLVVQRIVDAFQCIPSMLILLILMSMLGLSLIHSFRKLTTLLEKASHGRFGKEKAEQLKAAAASSFGVNFAKDAFAFQIRQLIEQLEFLERQVAELEEQIFSLLKQTGSYITTIPGIGDTLGAIILSEIGDIHRFDAPNKLVAFAGLDVRVTQSGEFTGTRQKISKRGSPYLRRAIWLAASRAAFCDSILSEYYQGLRARGKHHLTAVGAVSRKLCNTIYTILKEDRP